ncbi:MAG TPA: hypothetical protein VMT29_12975 [Steroidobacteraceae bacterium]|nr:hypothetical protein [Steroidobacteraceae bacterium]
MSTASTNEIGLATARTGQWLSMLVVGLVLVAVAVWFVFSYGYIEDDAYIHLEFARSVAEGRGFSFNGHVVYGDTAPLWVFILIAIHGLGLGWIASAKLACAAGVCLAVSGAWKLGQELLSRHLAILAVLVTLLNPYFVHWSFSGMETIAALGVSFWIVVLGVLGIPSVKRLLAGASLVALAPLLRPEFLLLDAIVAPILLWRLWQHLSARPTPQRIAACAVFAVLMAAPLMIWSVYALDTFGAIVPNTNLAKRGGGLRELIPRMATVYGVGFPLTLALLALAIPGLLRRRIPLAMAVLLLWPLACVAFYLLNHTVVQTRYILLSMPSMSIALLWLAEQRNGRRALIAAAGSMAAAGAIVIALIVVPHVSNKVEYVRLITRVASYMRESLPPQDRVAVFAIGQIAFESQHPLVDIGGITDRTVIPYMGSPTRTLQWAREQGARYIITGDRPEAAAEPVFTAAAPFIGWTFRHSQYSTQQPLVIYRLP